MNIAGALASRAGPEYLGRGGLHGVQLADGDGADGCGREVVADGHDHQGFLLECAEVGDEDCGGVAGIVGV